MLQLSSTDTDPEPQENFFPQAISQRNAPHLPAFLPLPASWPITRACKGDIKAL